MFTDFRAAAVRVGLAFILPITAAVIIVAIVAGLGAGRFGTRKAASAIPLVGVALTSWLVGLRWYGLPGLGLRGGRPLFAGIGFAVMAWVAFLVLRFIFVDIGQIGSPDSFRSFIYLLFFEAFAVQLWAFGLLFRAVADWRGGLTAAVSGGLLFGVVGTLLFQEAFASNLLLEASLVTRLFSTLYFLAWGILYGIIRLRTGSILGTVLVQAVQSFTAWIVFAPLVQPDAGQLQWLYLTSIIVYLIIIWRLWPRTAEDYRI